MNLFLRILIVLFTVNVGMSQDLLVISNDKLKGHYIDFTEGLDNNYYVLNKDNELFKFDFEGNVEEVELGLDSWTNVTSVEFGSDSLIYVSTSEGIFRLNKDNTLDKIYDDYILDFAFGKNGDIFAIGKSPFAKDAISVFSNGEWKGYKSDNSILKSERTYVVRVDNKGVAWVGSDDGLYRIKNNKLKLINDSPVWFIHIDENGKKYLAHSSGDLSTIEPGKTTLKLIPWQNATGRFITGNINGTIYATEGFHKLYIFNGNTWEEKSLDDFNVPSGIKRSMFMDKKGHMFLSVDSQNDIYIFKNNKVNTYSFDLSDDVTIMPNPVNDYLNIDFKSDFDKLSLIDSRGKLILEDYNIKNGYRLSMDNIKSGIYFLKLTKGDRFITKKVIVLKKK